MEIAEINKNINEHFNNEYSVTDKRIVKTKASQRTEFYVTHSTCGNSYWLQASRLSIKNFQTCPFCNKKKSKITNINFPDKVKSLVGDEYTVVGEYKNNYTKIKMKHNKCGKIIEVTPKHFLNDGHRCRECAYKERYNKNFITDLYNMSPNLKLVSEYTGAHSKIDVKCLKCGTIFSTTPHHIYAMYRKYGLLYCKSCAKTISIGEQIIIDFLKENSIQYIYNHSLPGCKYKAPLRFDFILKDKLGNNICIEYDGDQHFRQASFQTKEEFENGVLRDKIKTEYCEKNNIPLLRIKYKSKDKIISVIKSFLNNKLNDYPIGGEIPHQE